ncbi:MAG: response regulator transcription factor [Deltaproteobacteria bacterium]|nr:response regulator transcription factor [Deltaproteobacteria bacterium]
MMSDQIYTQQLLLVEDNPGDAFLVKKYLSAQNTNRFEITHVTHLAAAIDALQSKAFYAILLDLSLPDSQGLETIRQIAKLFPKVPVVVMTGLDDEATSMNALKEGAQDYLFKSERDLVNLERSIKYAVERNRIQESKIEAGIRNREGSAETMTSVQSGNLKLNLINQTVSITHNEQSQTFDLPPREFKLLFFLIKNEGKSVTRSEILNHVWSDEGSKPNPRCIDTLISSLKKKSDFFGKRIESIYGTGYKFI